MLRPLALPPRHLQGGNQLTCVPSELAQLTSLQRLRLSMNALEDAGTWGPLLALTQLVVLALDRNRCEGGRRAGRQAVSMWHAGRLGAQRGHGPSMRCRMHWVQGSMLRAERGVQRSEHMGWKLKDN